MYLRCSGALYMAAWPVEHLQGAGSSCNRGAMYIWPAARGFCRLWDAGCRTQRRVEGRNVSMPCGRRCCAGREARPKEICFG